MKTPNLDNLINDLKTYDRNDMLSDDGRSQLNEYEAIKRALSLHDVSGELPLTKEHQCFERGHAFYLVCEIDNGRSKYGDHKCSRCGQVEPFQYDYGSW